MTVEERRITDIDSLVDFLSGKDCDFSEVKFFNLRNQCIYDVKCTYQICSPAAMKLTSIACSHSVASPMPRVRWRNDVVYFCVLSEEEDAGEIDRVRIDGDTLTFVGNLVVGGTLK